MTKMLPTAAVTVRYQVFDRAGRLVTREKTCAGQAAYDRWVAAQERDNPNWMGVTAYESARQADEARRFATALLDTTDRYLAGMMARETWSAHMAGLWDQVDAAGLRAAVVPLVDPLDARRM